MFEFHGIKSNFEFVLMDLSECFLHYHYRIQIVTQSVYTAKIMLIYMRIYMYIYVYIYTYISATTKVNVMR